MSNRYNVPHVDGGASGFVLELDTTQTTIELPGVGTMVEIDVLDGNTIEIRAHGSEAFVLTQIYADGVLFSEVVPTQKASAR